MENAKLNTEMRDLLTTELERAATLAELLRAERGVLTTDAEAVESSARAKQSVIDELEFLHRRRVALLAEAGYSGDRSGMDSFVRGAAPASELPDLWNRLLTAVSECRDANQVNAAIVEAGRRTVRDTLALLHGQAPGAGTYDTNGQASDAGFSRSLAKA
jgi:flagellar biosynthesis/type III secretory pathway chaperone